MTAHQDQTEGFAPLVSIITPSFGQARWIEATLASVAMQDYGRIEHIVMDGGSADGTIEILEHWASAHPIVWRSERDGGQADAIEKGLVLANGAIVAWLNSDDVYLDEHVISDVVDRFASGARIVAGAGWYIDAGGKVLSEIPVSARRLSHAATVAVDWFLQPATFVARDLIETHPLDTSLHFAFDWDLFIRLTGEAPVDVLDRPLAGYRLHSTAKTQSGGYRRDQELLLVTRRYQGRSPRYLLLLAVIRARRAASAFPRPIRVSVERLIHTLTVMSWQLTDGRGIPG